MPNPSYGLIVEGTYDEPVYRELVSRLSSSAATVFVRVCGGVGKLMQAFPRYLREFEHVRNGSPVDKALVIRDADDRAPSELEKLMASRISHISFAFPRGIQFCAVRRELETWLLADAEAINAVARARARARGGRRVAEVQGTLEDIADPKQELVQVLSQARLNYLPAVCAEIAREAKIDMLRYRCPSFRSFQQKVLDC